MGVALLAVALCIGSLPSALNSDVKVPVLIGRSGPADGRLEALVAQLGGHVDKELRIIEGIRASVPASAVSLLRSLPGVRFAEPDHVVHLQGQMGQDSGVASAVYTDATRASKAWGMGATGKGVNVAVIDTGVNTTGDLAGKVVHAEDFTPELDNNDNYGHGTFVAGLIAGSGAASNGAVKGVAPDAGIVALKIAGRDGLTDVTRVLEALEWVVDYKDAYDIRVVNLSLGFTAAQSYRVDPLDFAVERVWNAGVVVVAAAGNNGNAPGNITKPGDDPMVITVGTSNDRTTVGTSDDNLSTFSSGGPTAVDKLAKPDLLAPGRSVISSRSPGSNIDVSNPASVVGTSYFKGSGTSFSTGVASGIAALVIQRTWSLNPNQVKHRLTATTRMPVGGLNPATGTGVIDAFAATMSTDNSEANNGVAPATGGGSLQLTRGAACIRDDAGGCLSDADADGLLGFDSARYFGDDWAGSEWVGSQWVGSEWVGSQWVGSQWVGSQWVGSQWVSSDWAGSQWVGSQWVGSQWVGSQWVGSQWVGSQWVNAPWSGAPWASIVG